MNRNQYDTCPECENELADSWECPSCTGADYFDEPFSDEPFSGESIDEEEGETDGFYS